MQRNGVILIAFSLCAILVPHASWADDGVELRRIEGRFERQFQDAAGAKLRAVRESIGNQSTVTTYDEAGNVLEAHVSTIQVEKRGPVRVLSYFNLIVTAGPHQGLSQPATRRYAYRLDGDTFTEVWGILEDDDSPPRIFTWRRVKEAN